MGRIRNLLTKLIFPKPFALLLLIIISTAGLYKVFAGGYDKHPASAFVYTLSAYTLCPLSIKIYALIKRGRGRLEGNRLYRKYREDLRFRGEISIKLSLILTIAYCLLKSGAGIYFRSVWLGSMAFYYLVLGLLRYILWRGTEALREDEAGAKRICSLLGYLLFILTLALAAMAFYTIAEDQVIKYPSVLVYAAAAFTFYNLAMALVNIQRYRKLGMPLYTASKLLSLATALVSLFFLQCSLISEFGSGGEMARLANMLTGGAVFLLIFGMAIYMIRSAGKEPRKTKD